ncbi:MAG: hypothetical protein N2Z69_03015 [Methylophilaceae bacterium]|nr:hypothetical protein [Methylophilaceae bacterium]
MIRQRILLFAFLLAMSPGIGQSANDVTARVEAQRQVLSELEESAPPDTVFQYNTGLSMPQQMAEKLGGRDSSAAQSLKNTQGSRFRDRIKRTLGSDVPDLNADDLLNARIEEIGTRLKSNESKVIMQQKLIDNIKHSHEQNLKLERDLKHKQVQLAREIEALGLDRLALKGKRKKRVQREIRFKERELREAIAAGKELQVQRTKLGLVRLTNELDDLQRGISLDKAHLKQLERAKGRQEIFKKGSNLLGIAMTFFSAVSEENAQAKKEGRPPLLTNKLGNFIKGISGYSTVMGVIDNVERAKIESVLDSVEFYEKLGFDMMDPRILKNVEASARRAVIKAGLIEGAKLAPVVGDLVAIKEATDAALSTYAA